MSALDVEQYRSAYQREVRAAIAPLLPLISDGVTWNLDRWIEHWSPSSLAMLQRCPYQWQQRYIHGRKERPGEAPVMGTTIHAALERNFAQKIQSFEDLPLVDLLDWYMDEAFARIVFTEQEKAGEEVIWDTSPDETRRRGRSIIASYHDQVAPRIQPQRVETMIEVDFGAPVPVQGRFDLERVESTVDFKTGKTKQTKPKEAWRIQGAVYGEATGKPVEFHSLSASAKTNTVQIVTPLEAEALLVNPSADERAEMRRSIRALSTWACVLMATYGPDEPWPTLGRFHTWACDYCGFRAGCPAWKE